MNRAILTHYKNHILLAYLEEDKPVELQLFYDNPYPVGTIFQGRIQRTVKNISASFVDLAPHVSGFLPGCAYKCGSYVPVQIVREGSALKECELTDDLSIAGRYAVVYAKSGEIHTSSKLSAKEKKDLLHEILPLIGDIDRMVILRTNALSADPQAVAKEIGSLHERLNHIEKYAASRPMSVLFAPGKEWITAVRDLYTDRLDEIVTDDPAVFSDLQTAFDEPDPSSDQVNLRLYEDTSFSLTKLYSLERHLKEALGKKVWLKSGGFLMIEQTEALVSIDVNSAKVTAKSDREDTFLAVNKEAAVEIARQLRLRNLSGIIMIDFINMKEYAHQAELQAVLQDALRKDPVKTQVHGMTKLGLMEMTRMKGRRSLYEQTRAVSDDETVSGDKGSI